MVPDAVEESDPSAQLVDDTDQSGTYNGSIVAIAPHARDVNLTFASGVELLD